jgi:hypothetical protein
VADAVVDNVASIAAAGVEVEVEVEVEVGVDIGFAVVVEGAADATKFSEATVILDAAVATGVVTEFGTGVLSAFSVADAADASC